MSDGKGRYEITAVRGSCFRTVLTYIAQVGSELVRSVLVGIGSARYMVHEVHGSSFLNIHFVVSKRLWRLTLC